MISLPRTTTLFLVIIFAFSVPFAYAQNQPNTDVFTTASEPGFELPSLSAQGNMGGGFDTTPRPTSSMTPQQQSDFARSIAQKERCGPQDNGTYILCEPIPFINPIQKDPAALLRQLYILALILAGSVAFIQIVRGGILYSISGVVDGKNRAKSIFKGVAQGLALLMGSYVILNTINPALVTLRFPDADNYFPPVPSLSAQADAFGSATPEQIAAAMSETVDEQEERLDAAEARYEATQSEITRLQGISKWTPAEESRLQSLREDAQEQSVAVKVEKDVLTIFSAAEESAKKDVYMENIDKLEVQKAAESQGRKASAAKDTFHLRQEEIARLQELSGKTTAQNQQLSKLKADAARDYAAMQVERDLSLIFNAAANDKK